MYREDGELRVPSSNMSTTSAFSSNMGSPQSNPGQLAYQSVFTHNAVGVNLTIVSDYYGGPAYSGYIDSKPGYIGE